MQLTGYDTHAGIPAFVLGFFSGGERRAFYWKSLIIVLLKLRLNLGIQDIAYRLGVSVATVSRRFHETLDLMTTIG